MTTTSGYSGRLGGRSGPDQIQNARLLGYREAQKRIAREAQVAVVVVAADGPNETAYDDERQTVYDVHLAVLMG
jgi:hypothetical protein